MATKRQCKLVHIQRYSNKLETNLYINSGTATNLRQTHVQTMMRNQTELAQVNWVSMATKRQCKLVHIPRCINKLETGHAQTVMRNQETCPCPLQATKRQCKLLHVLFLWVFCGYAVWCTSLNFESAKHSSCTRLFANDCLLVVCVYVFFYDVPCTNLSTNQTKFAHKVVLPLMLLWLFLVMTFDAQGPDPTNASSCTRLFCRRAGTTLIVMADEACSKLKSLC